LSAAGRDNIRDHFSSEVARSSIVQMLALARDRVRRSEFIRTVAP